MKKLVKCSILALSLFLLASASQPTEAEAGQKITICHKGKVTMSVSAKSFVGHALQHRDSIGACGAT